MDTYIDDFHASFYIPEIKKASIPPATCSNINYRDTSLCKPMPLCIQKLYSVSRYAVLSWLCRSSGSQFSHQIQSQYYGGNRYVSIEGVLLEHFSATKHP